MRRYALALVLLAVGCSGSSTPTSPGGGAYTSISIAGNPVLDIIGTRYTSNPLTVQGNFMVGTSQGQVVLTSGVTWTSSAPNIATVDVNGVVTAVTRGTATITAQFGNLSATQTMTVLLLPYVVSFTADQTTVPQGGSTTLRWVVNLATSIVITGNELGPGVTVTSPGSLVVYPTGFFRGIQTGADGSLTETHPAPPEHSKEFGAAYDKGRRSYGLFSALLVLWELFGVDLSPQMLNRGITLSVPCVLLRATW